MIENVKTKDGDIVVLYKVGNKQSMYFDLIFFQNSFTGQISKKTVVTQVVIATLEKKIPH